MKATQKRRSSGHKPKHKHTKEYLKHYYPFLPMLVGGLFLLGALFAPLQSLSQQSVKGVEVSELQQTLLASTNTTREQSNLSDLTANSKLTNAAENKAKDMVRNNYWSHTSPSGEEPWQFIKDSQYAYSLAGENLAYGFTDSDSIINAWLSSPAHRDNVLNSEYSEVGFGTATSSNYQEGGPAIVVVAMYAKPYSATSSVAGESNILGVSDRAVNLASASTGKSWTAWIVFGLTALGVVYLFTTQSKSLKKYLRKGEKFIVKHPVIDALILVLVSFGILLLKTTGKIM